MIYVLRLVSSLSAKQNRPNFHLMTSLSLYFMGVVRKRGFTWFYLFRVIIPKPHSIFVNFLDFQVVFLPWVSNIKWKFTESLFKLSNFEYLGQHYVFRHYSSNFRVIWYRKQLKIKGKYAKDSLGQSFFLYLSFSII